MSFCFVGQMNPSKSLYNRALMVQSFYPNFNIKGNIKSNSEASDDVTLMKKAVEGIYTETEFDCGHAGTVFRFLALRLARETGEYCLKGSERLFARPHSGLLKLLRQLGCEVNLEKDRLLLKTYGWCPQGDALHIDGHESSQFATSVFLSSWNLDKDIFVSVTPKMVSQSYFEMTLDFLKKMGLSFTQNENEFKIFARSAPDVFDYTVEPDMSSLFALASAAVVDGNVVVNGVPDKSLQPDSKFTEIYNQMNIPFSLAEGRLKVDSCENWSPLELNLNNQPDLFPVLSALCALTEGESYLYGAKHLRFKESNRIEKIAELLILMGRKVEILEDGLKITGTRGKLPRAEVTFDTDQDHRLAMAAGLFIKAGVHLNLKNPQVVEKSYPLFWQNIGENFL